MDRIPRKSTSSSFHRCSQAAALGGRVGLTRNKTMMKESLRGSSPLEAMPSSSSVEKGNALFDRKWNGVKVRKKKDNNK